jgi:hypothetical protein
MWANLARTISRDILQTKFYEEVSMSFANVINITKKRTAVEIHDDAKKVCKNIKGKFVELFEILLEVEARQIYHQFDLPSLYVYCVEMLDLSPQVAKDFIVVTRKSIEVPALRNAVCLQRVTIPKARKICPVITQRNAEEWIALAAECSCRVVEKTVALAKPDVMKTESLNYVSADHLKLGLSVSEEWSEFLRRTKELQSQKAQRPVGTEEALLILMKDFCQKNDPVEKANREKVKIMKKMKSKVIGNSEKQPKTANEGIASRRRNRYRLRAVEHAVNLRDQNQCVHIDKLGNRCSERKWLHKHHVQEFAKGGEHTVENLQTLCFGHHKMLHRLEGVT